MKKFMYKGEKYNVPNGYRRDMSCNDIFDGDCAHTTCKECLICEHRLTNKEARKAYDRVQRLKEIKDDPK